MTALRRAVIFLLLIPHYPQDFFAWERGVNVRLFLYLLLFIVIIYTVVL